MKLLRQYQMLSFVLVFLSIVGLCLAQQSVGLLLVAGALAAISWTITEGPRGRRLPRWAANILILTVTLLALVEYFQGTADVLYILGQFALWLTLIKLYERRTPRDHSQLLFLSLLVMLIGCLHSTDLLFAVILLLYAGLGLYVVLLYQMYASYERERQARTQSIPAGYRVVPRLKPITGQRVGLHFRSLVSSVGVAGVMLSALAFLMFPRGVGEAALTSMPDPMATVRPGFTGEVDLIQGGRITDSRRVVMHLQLRDKNDRLIPEAAPIRLRGAVLDAYKGNGKWKSSEPTAHVNMNHVQFSKFVEQIPADGQLIVQDIRTIQDSSVLFSKYAPLAVESPNTFRIGFDPNRMIIAAEHGERTPRRYRVLAHPVPTDEVLAGLPRWPQIPLVTYEKLTDSKVASLARDLLERANVRTEPPESNSHPSETWHWHREAANVFLQYLHSPNFRYTIDLSDVTMPISSDTGRELDPVRFFLFDLRRGHCEYFASAFVSLCHNVGIEARLVTGYLAATYDARWDRYTVMERNAHAWAEVRTGERRWATFDPTPPAILEEFHRGETGLIEQMRWVYDRFDGLWNQAVVSYDERTQTELASAWDDEALIEWLKLWGERIRAWLNRVNQAFYFGPAGYIYIAFLTGLLVFFLIVLIGMLRRMLKIRRALHMEHLRGRAYRRMLRQLGFYLDMLRILRRAGMEKPNWRPPMDHAERVAAQRPEVADRVRAVTNLFYEARYGERKLRGDDRRRLEQLLDEIAEALNVRRGGWLT